MLTCTKPEMVALLGEFIRSTSDVRELKRALAVKMAIEGKPYREIAELLEVYKSFITRWKQEFYEKGIEGLKLGYHGRKSHLLEEERQEIIDWLQTKDYWNLDELITHIDTNYDIIYRSKQSYYDLFSEAGITWKRSQKVNPKTELEVVKKNKKKFKNLYKSISLKSGQDGW